MAARRRPAGVIHISGASRAPRLTRARLAELVRFVAAAEGRTIGEIDLAIVKAEEMGELNFRYLRRRGATDVLSFDLSDRPGRAITAQLIVCSDVAAAQARARGHAIRRELMLYVVHALLHLTGHNDAAPADTEAMHAREDQLLTDFGEGPAYGK